MRSGDAEGRRTARRSDATLETLILLAGPDCKKCFDRVLRPPPSLSMPVGQDLGLIQRVYTRPQERTMDFRAHRSTVCHNQVPRRRFLSHRISKALPLLEGSPGHGQLCSLSKNICPASPVQLACWRHPVTWHRLSPCLIPVLKRTIARGSQSLQPARSRLTLNHRRTAGTAKKGISAQAVWRLS